MTTATRLDPVPVRCDRCGAEIVHGGWAVPTGRTDPELHAPIVEIVCHGCHDAEREPTVTTTNPLADAIRDLADQDPTEMWVRANQLADQVERLAAEPDEPAAQPGAEQQIRAWAVDTAAYHGSDSHHSSPAALAREWCEIADLVGAYIRDGSAP